MQTFENDTNYAEVTMLQFNTRSMSYWHCRWIC